MHIKHIFVLISIFLLLTPSSVTASSNFYLNTERSNYTPGHGNITYPVITHSSSENCFSRNIAVGDINGDGKKEIVGLSAKGTRDKGIIDRTLYTYSSNLSLLWKYKVEDPMMKYNISWEDMNSALALTDLDGDGSDEIVFSISPSVGPIKNASLCSTSLWSETVLHVLKGDGTELWNRTFLGGITRVSLGVADINGDGRDEIIVGCKNLYILDSNGQILSSYSPDNYTYRGISELAVHGKEIVFTFWYYNQTDDPLGGWFRVANSFYRMEKLEYQNNSFHLIWSLQLENDKYLIFSSAYWEFYSSEDFSMAYIIKRVNTVLHLAAINLTTGKIEWTTENAYDQCSVAVLDKDKIIWNTGHEIYLLNKSGKVMASVQSDHRELWSTISVFDVNNDGTDDVVVVYRNGIEFYSLPDLKKELNVNLWGTVLGYSPVILHSDIDNDGFDEIITPAPLLTTKPRGKILIIDNGTPPAPPPPEENKFPVNELIIAGTGIIGAVALITVVLWKKQKRRKSK